MFKIMSNYQKYKELIEKQMEIDYKNYKGIYYLAPFLNNGEKDFIEQCELKYPEFRNRISRDYLNTLKEKNNGK